MLVKTQAIKYCCWYNKTRRKNKPLYKHNNTGNVRVISGPLIL